MDVCLYIYICLYVHICIYIYTLYINIDRYACICIHNPSTNIVPKPVPLRLRVPQSSQRPRYPGEDALP